MSRITTAVRQREPIEEKGPPAHLAEFLGTLVLVLRSARSPDATAASGTWTDAWLYILAPIVGAGIAAFTYRAIMDMSAIPTQTARRGESVQQPPVAAG